ncbi:MAG: cysteine--tRNA ligase [Desulfurella sp.]|jgi:cysteinyl-tRNA synthetase|uniref:Cysteine--tRNA ligase n=1 Tax=Desulfurella multipotens TaxID=79269 RepID=A0A1G6LRT9_9BACT|nr:MULTISPECIES: cysteine--tRNA ligase [Desulfurella]PMP92924.1 MAG: cysteine--tRNA ligase [Desulfurella sp.]SDC45919.1 cysteinyl-tRNA synthetase [Desulfurella multipotens]HEX13490.1 cysteine--tRNA ligase [Desulfurella acetivorans]
MLKIFNTQTKKLEEFVPLNDNIVTMYVCGVTVYDYCHVGHARSAICFDVIYRYLLYKGYDVKFVKNFTDIDDKIINKANEENKPFDEISEKYIKEFYTDMEAIGIKKPTFEPKATMHIKDIIDFISKLIEKGYAYEVDGDVYYSVSKFEAYGKLSHKKIEELKAGARIDINENKKDPLDFVLWKKSKPNEPSWDSPWGKGRPGWHIECSVMSMYYLGETIDIHGGGEDLIFPHHENEIAQSEALSDKQFVRYWIHNGFIKINNEKMSKSLGNFFTIRDVLKKFNGETLRYYMLLTHYRNPIDFSYNGLLAAKEALNRYYTFLMRLDNTKFGDEAFRIDSIETLIFNFENAMDNDFNTPQAIAEVFNCIKDFNLYLDTCQKNNLTPSLQLKKTFLNSMSKIAQVLGVFDKSYKEWYNLENNQWIEEKIKQRNKAKREKNYALADSIRNELLNAGIILEDYKDKTIWKKIK